VELDLFDAIRLHRIVQIEAGGATYSVEPHGVHQSDQGSGILRAFVICGPTLGWQNFADWSNLKISGKQYAPRSDTLESQPLRGA
jgi:hypothetical protein